MSTPGITCTCGEALAQANRRIMRWHGAARSHSAEFAMHGEVAGACACPEAFSIQIRDLEYPSYPVPLLAFSHDIQIDSTVFLQRCSHPAAASAAGSTAGLGGQAGSHRTVPDIWVHRVDGSPGNATRRKTGRHEHGLVSLWHVTWEGAGDLCLCWMHLSAEAGSGEAQEAHSGQTGVLDI